MKIYFTGYGYREFKSWSCSNCNNYHVGGMDLFVDGSIKEHQATCFNTPRFTGFDNIEPEQTLLSKRLNRMQKWVAMRAPWVFIDKEMELILEAFNK